MQRQSNVPVPKTAHRYNIDNKEIQDRSPEHERADLRGARSYSVWIYREDFSQDRNALEIVIVFVSFE